MGSETILLFFWAPQKQSGPALARQARPSTDMPEYRCSGGLDPSGPRYRLWHCFLCRKEETLSQAASLYPDPAPSSLALGLRMGASRPPKFYLSQRRAWVGGWGPVGRVGSEVRRLGPCLPPTGPGQPWAAQASGFTSGKGVCFPGQRYQGGKRSSIPANGNKNGRMEIDAETRHCQNTFASSSPAHCQLLCSVQGNSWARWWPSAPGDRQGHFKSPPARSDSPASSQGA